MSNAMHILLADQRHIDGEAISPEVQDAWDRYVEAREAQAGVRSCSLQPLGETQALVHFTLRGDDGFVSLDYVAVGGHIVPVCEFALGTLARWRKAIQEEFAQ